MAKLELSQKSRTAIERLRTLDAVTYDAVVSALSQTTSPDPALVASKLPQHIDDSEGIVQLVFSLHHTLGDSNVELAKFITDIVESMRDTWTKASADVDVADFEARLVRLLGVDEVRIVIKAARVLTDYERALYDVRIVSDLRPVFDDDISRGPLGMGIVHTLEIRFHKNGSSHERFYAALNSADLKKLRGAVDRAEAKVASLRESLEQAGVKYLEGE